MDELINLIVEIRYQVFFSDLINRWKPFYAYVNQAEEIPVEEAGNLLRLIRENDWHDRVNGKLPALILFKGKKNLSVYLLDEYCQFLRRLYSIASPFIQEKNIVIKL